MNVELVSQMFKNYQSNVLFNLECMSTGMFNSSIKLNNGSYRQFKGLFIAGIL